MKVAMTMVVMTTLIRTMRTLIKTSLTLMMGMMSLTTVTI